MSRTNHIHFGSTGESVIKYKMNYAVYDIVCEWTWVLLYLSDILNTSRHVERVLKVYFCLTTQICMLSQSLDQDL